MPVTHRTLCQCIGHKRWCHHFVRKDGANKEEAVEPKKLQYFYYTAGTGRLPVTGYGCIGVLLYSDSHDSIPSMCYATSSLYLALLMESTFACQNSCHRVLRDASECCNFSTCTDLQQAYCCHHQWHIPYNTFTMHCNAEGMLQPLSGWDSCDSMFVNRVAFCCHPVHPRCAITIPCMLCKSCKSCP